MYMKLLTGLVIFVTQTAVGGTAVLSGGHDRKLPFVSVSLKVTVTVPVPVRVRRKLFSLILSHTVEQRTKGHSY